MTVPFVAIAFLSFLSPGPVEVNVNVKDGDTIGGVETFRVTVKSDETVNQVEFSVGADLRANATSTPYIFTLDTINEDDGDLTVSFTAYTAEGSKSKKTVKLKIDNGISKGPEVHVQKANDLLSVSKWDDAMQEARIALKAKKNFNPARVAMARANLGKGILDKAQKFAEDAVDSDPKDVNALELLADINLRKAFITVRRADADKAEALTLIKQALIAAVDSRDKVLQAQLDGFGAPTASNLASYADVALRAHRYTLAIDALSAPVKKDFSQSKLVDRLAYAQMRAARYDDAMLTLADATKQASLDTYGQALQALLFHQTNQARLYDSTIQAAVLNDSEDLGVRTVLAYVALADNKNAVLANFASDLDRDQGSRTEVNYLLSALSYKLQRFSDAQKYFERAVLSEPTNYDMYIEYANQSIDLGQKAKASADAASRAEEIKQEYATAQVMFDAALEAKPDSGAALAGRSIIALLQGNTADSVKFGRAATLAAPTYAAAWYALAAGYNASRMDKLAQDADNKAGVLDRANLEGREVPDAPAAWRYFSNAGRTPLISPPG